MDSFYYYYFKFNAQKLQISLSQVSVWVLNICWPVHSWVMLKMWINSLELIETEHVRDDIKRWGERKNTVWEIFVVNATRKQSWNVQGYTLNCTKRNWCFSFVYLHLWLFWLILSYVFFPIHFSPCSVPWSRKVSFHMLLLKWTKAKPFLYS